MSFRKLNYCQKASQNYNHAILLEHLFIKKYSIVFFIKHSDTICSKHIAFSSVDEKKL